MSIGVLHGQNGGGIKLPFRVIGGTTQPSNPKDGTIWVKTSVPITQLEFANGTWAPGRVGLVFFAGTLGGSNPTGENSTVWALNNKVGDSKYILKLTLTGCKQVQGSTGNWVNLDAYRYYGGTWVQFSSEFSATINITYPAGSVCTATDGTTTLTAPDTSGTWAYKVDKSGTWTITCNGRTKTVSVSTSGSSVSVDLTVMELFYNGNQYTSMTGGWVAVEREGIDVAIGTNIEFSIVSDISRDAAVFTSNKVDLTNYTKLQFVVNVKTVSSWFHIGITSAKGSPTPSFVSKVSTRQTGSQTMTLDISSIKGSYHIAAYADVSAATVTKVQLL